MIDSFKIEAFHLQEEWLDLLDQFIPDDFFQDKRLVQLFLSSNPEKKVVALSFSHNGNQIGVGLFEELDIYKFGVKTNRLVPLQLGWYSNYLLKQGYSQVTIIGSLVRWLKKEYPHLDILESMFVKIIKADLPRSNFEVKLPNCPYLVMEDEGVRKLAPSVKALLKSLKCQGVSNINNERNRLLKAGYRFITPTSQTDAKKHIESLINLHIEKWAQEGFKSRYRKSDNQRFLLEMIQSELYGETIKIHIIEHNQTGKTIAVAICYYDQQRLYYTLPIYDPHFNKFSPGKVLLSYIIEEAYYKGFTEIDYGPGEELYKIKWSSKLRYRMKHLFPLKSHLILLLLFECRLYPWLQKTSFFRWAQRSKRKLIKISSRNRGNK